MRLSGSGGVVLAAVLGTGGAAGVATVGCSARNLDVDVGPRVTDAGDGVGDDLLSTFDVDNIARIEGRGTPPRFGYWYSYNDMSALCVQQPPFGELARPSVPPTASPLGGGLALRSTWGGCSVWGAGIAADLDLVAPGDGGVAYKVPYDLTAYRGITFWAAATPGSDTKLRFKVVMRAEARVQDGGACDENLVGVNKCGDSWGQGFTLPDAGYWQQITVVFTDETRFKQEGWGAPFAWDPRDVLSIQIQSQATEFDRAYDIWIDDVYLVR